MADIPCITTHSISKSFGSRPLFTDISFSFSPNEKLGLIGPNGSGKSTLLKILADIEYPDSGDVSWKRGTSLTYLPQEDIFNPNKTVAELLFADLPADLEKWERAKRVDEIRALVEFDDLQQQVGQLSGGWRKRLAIGQALLRNPDVLLMDEPTNHLDLEGILWLEKLLKSAKFAFILVSHDRFFLENVTNRIVELDRRYINGYLKVEGNYSVFIERRARYIAQQTRQELTLSNTVRREIEWLRRGPKARTTKARSRRDSANQLIDDLAEVKYRNTLKRSARIDFDATERKTKILLAGKKLTKSRSGNLLFQNLDLTLSPQKCIGIMGRNGSGKSTLIDILNGSLQPDSGYIKRADAVKIVKFDQNRYLADESHSLQQALVDSGDSVIYRGKTIHILSWAKRFLFKPEQLELPVAQLSGGEKARILLANLMLKPAEILLLDEPTNDLDIPTLEVLEENLREFPGAIVLISHDRFLIDRLCDELIYLGSGGEVKYFADYNQLYRYQLSRQPEKSKEAPLGLQKLSQIKREIQKDISRIEKKIHLVEEKQAALKNEMNDPRNISNAGKLAELFAELRQTEDILEKLYSDWEKLESQQTV